MTTQLSPYATLIFFSLLFVLSVWQSRRLAFGHQFVVAILVAMVSFQLLFFLQGFVIMAFGYLLHDVCVHRKFGGKRFSYWLSLVSGILSFTPPSHCR